MGERGDNAWCGGRGREAVGRSRGGGRRGVNGGWAHGMGGGLKIREEV